MDIGDGVERKYMSGAEASESGKSPGQILSHGGRAEKLSAPSH